jgi:hypothetical protein
LRWNLHACSDKRTVGWDRAATGGGSFVGNDRGIASWSAIRGQEHLIVGALHRAICRIARRANDANTRGGAGWTLIAFGARGSGRPAIALRSLTLTATHHGAGQHNRNEGSGETHGDLRLDLRAYRNERIVRRPGGAARCGSLRCDDGGVSFRAAIGGQKHLALSALHTAGRLVAVGAKDANARRRAGRAGITRWTFGTRRSLITHWAFPSLAPHDRRAQPDQN